MRAIKSLPDAQKAINELLDFKDKLSSKSWDLHGLRITNAGAAQDDTDYVIKSQLGQLVGAQPPADQFYTQVFETTGAVSDGDKSPPFVVQSGREGFPYLVWIAATNPPTTDASVNIQLNGFNLLTVDLVLPAASGGPVTSALFVTPKPKLGTLSKLILNVIHGGGASLMSVGLVVKRLN